MRYGVVIAMVLGTASCRQILGIEPGTVRFDDAALDDADGAPLEDALIDMPIDTPSNVWSDPEIVAGLAVGDEDPTLTGDMLEIYFTRADHVYFATRTTVTAPWSTPAIAMFGMAGSDQTPEMTPEGLFLQFASERGPGLQYDIYVTSRNNRTAVWQPPVALDSLNTTGFDERPGSATVNGARITLSSYRDGMGLDLYEANRPGALGTPYEAPVRIPLSTAGEEGSPFLSGDGRTLYYASSPMGFAQRDLYMSTRAALTDQFTVGTRIDELSTSFNDSDPWVSPDGDHIYFVSSRDGASKIWYATRIVEN